MKRRTLLTLTPLMALALVFSLPPIVVYYALRRYMVAGLTMGGVKS